MEKSPIQKKAPRLISMLLVLVFLLAIFLSGTYLRISSLEKQAYWIDEGFSLSQAQAIANQGYPLLDSGKVDFKDLLHGYLIAGIIKLDGLQPVILRGVSVLFGIGSILLAYFIYLKLADNVAGLTLAFFIAFSYWHIAWSREIRGYSLVVFLIFAAVYSLVFYQQEKKTRYLYLAIISIVLAALTKAIAALLFFSLILYLFFSKRKLIAEYILLFFLVFGAIAYPFIEKNYHISWNNNFLYYMDGYYWKHFGIFFVLALCGSLLALWKDRQNRPVHVFIVSFCLSGLLLLSLFTYVTQFRYAFVFSFAIFFYAAYFIYYFGQLFSKKLLVMAVLLIGVVAFDHYHTAERPALAFVPCGGNCILENYTPQPNFSEAYGYLKDNLKENDFLLSAYPFMDRLYLEKSGYALAISYTGRAEDLSVTSDRKEYYSGSEEIYSANRIIEMTKTGDVYALMDDMALSRTDEKIRNFIYFNSEKPFTVPGNEPGQGIYVYKLKKNMHFFEEKSESPAVSNSGVGAAEDAPQDVSADDVPKKNNEDIIFEVPDKQSSDDEINIEIDGEDNK